MVSNPCFEYIIIMGICIVQCTITKLETKKKREDWEKMFSESFIQPVLIVSDN